MSIYKITEDQINKALIQLGKMSLPKEGHIYIENVILSLKSEENKIKEEAKK